MQELYHHCRHFRFRWCSPTTSRRFLRFFKTPKKSDPPLSAQTIAAHKHTRSRWSPTSIHFSEWIRKVSLTLSCRPWTCTRPHYTSQFSFQAVLLHPTLPETLEFLSSHIHKCEGNNQNFISLALSPNGHNFSALEYMYTYAYSPAYRPAYRFYRPWHPVRPPQRRRKWIVILVGAIIVIAIMYGAHCLSRIPQVKTSDRYSPTFDPDKIYQEGEIPFNEEVWQMFRNQMTPPPQPRHQNSSPFHPPRPPPSPAFVPTKNIRKRLTKKQKKIILSEQRYKCATCGKRLHQWDCEMDHIVQLSMANRGIHPEVLNRLSNYRALCRACHGYQTMQQRKSGLFRKPT